MDKILDLLVRITDKMKSDKLAKETVAAEYKAKEKTKALTQSERLDRIEKILEIK